MNTLKELQDWYHSNCDGEWEHDFGVKIDTLDNPGWYVDINLAGTKCENRTFTEVKLKRGDHDWIHCRVENKVFLAEGGPENLEEVLQIFLKWANPSRDKNRNSKKK